MTASTGGTSRLVRAGVAVAALALLASGASANAAAKKPKRPVITLGPNLVVNPGFELSAFEGNPAVAPGTLPQPLLPTGWSFEGLTELFDHSPNVHHSGLRSAAVSGSLSGGRERCDTGSCVANPTNGVKDSTSSRYTLAPHWRVTDAIKATAGQAYRLTFWGNWSQVTIKQGLDAQIRWVDAAGTTVQQQLATELRSTPQNYLALQWKQISIDVVAPAGATGAILMLGQTDDLWTGQVVFDDVYFGTLTKK